MKIGLTGASGFIGCRIVALARERGWEVVAYSRDPARDVPGCVETRRYSTDGTMDFAGCEAVIHLAGEKVFGLWTESKRRRIRQSRVLGTRSVAESIRAAGVEPRVLVSSSAIGFYGDTGERPVDEDSGKGSGFLADVAEEWEREAAGAAPARVVTVRTGIVLGPSGGALAVMAAPFRFGLGGEIGDGGQWMSWIHLDDIARLYLHAVENEEVRGPLNGVAPEPVRNSDFTDALAQELGRPAVFRAPEWMLRRAAGEFSRELLDSKRVLPKRTLEAGFTHRFPGLPEAIDASL